MRAFAIVMMAVVVCAGKDLSAREVEQSAKTIQTFTLSDYRGKPHSLADLADRKLIVVAFLGTECPLVKLYAPRLARLQQEYASQGVAFLGIASNRQDSLTEIAAYARHHQIEFPILKDLQNKVADHFGVQRTPEVFVLDAGRNVRYRGRIDDQYAVGVKRESVTRHDLKEAIDELLAGSSVSQPVTPVSGCLIGKTRPPKEDAKVTYSNQIARLFQKRCVECHREGQIAPFALTDYEEVVGWAEMIKEVVEDNRMPPWHADRKHGNFINNRRLSDEEKSLIKQWVADGAPEGDKEDLPAPVTYPSGWQLSRQPDLILEMSKESFTVAAEGRIQYQYFTIDPGFKTDKWVEAAQVMPGNPAVVHHILVAAQPKGKDDPDHLNDIRGYLASYVAGLAPKPYPKGMAKRIAAGSLLTFQVHYSSVGTEQTDCSKLGLLFADPKSVTHEVRTTSALQPDFEIPPGVRGHRVDAFSPHSPTDLWLLSMLPHMHMRGKSFQYEAIYPNGRKEVLLRVPQYDFNWQTSYQLAKLKPLPRGTRIHCTAHFDNSEANLNNPDPGATVKWGSQAWEEMMIGYFDVAMKLPGK